MGTVVGAHRKGCQIVQIPIFYCAEGLFFRFWIAGIDLTGEHPLGNIIDLRAPLKTYFQMDAARF